MADVILGESKIHGIGVFAARDFSEGETILDINDSRVVDEKHPLRTELGEYDHHCDYLAGGKVIHMQLPERHINSSCDPNTFVKTIDGIRHVVARRQIKAGEELTSDYIIDCHSGIVWQCNCGTVRCRGTIVSSFFELPLELQLEYLPLLNDWFIEEHMEKVEALRRRAPQIKDKALQIQNPKSKM
jgi:SET domain-containing protein